MRNILATVLYLLWKACALAVLQDTEPHMLYSSQTDCVTVDWMAVNLDVQVELAVLVR